jgi:Uma2 family endonuclease
MPQAAVSAQPRLPTEDDLPWVGDTPPRLPTQDDLPYDDGIPMETQFHLLQMQLLMDSLQDWLAEHPDTYVGGNMFLYFSAAQLRHNDFVGPDFFLVKGVSTEPRKSWVVWEEGKAPDLVIELLSKTTADNDKGKKKRIYQDLLRVPEYYWYDPLDARDWAGFFLDNGHYRPIEPDASERLVSPMLGLCLARWQGTYKGAPLTWLRWARPDGALLPTTEEKLEAAQQQAAAAEKEAVDAGQRARAAEQRAEAAESELKRLRALLERPGQ